MHRQPARSPRKQESRTIRRRQSRHLGWESYFSGPGESELDFDTKLTGCQFAAAARLGALYRPVMR